MLDLLDRMSAPNLLTSTIKSSIELAAAAANGKSQNPVVGSKPKDSELIDSKFNELAKKILEELKQAHYAKDFFQAIDDIIKEPAGQINLAHNQHNHHHQQTHRKLNQQNNNNNLQTSATQLNSTIQRQNSVRDARQALEQPRSLPVDVTQGSFQPQQPRQYQQQQQQLQTTSPQQRQKSSAAGPTTTTTTNNTTQNGFLLASPKKSIKVESQTGVSYPISKSATTGDTNVVSLRRQQSLRKSPGVSVQTDDSIQMQTSGSNNNLSPLYKRQKNYSTSAILANKINRSVEDDDEDDDDDDDIDDDDDDEDDGDGYYLREKNLHSFLNQRNQSNSIAKSKTQSETSNISEMNNMPAVRQQSGNPATTTTRQQATQLLQPRQQQQQQQQTVQQQKQRQRFNPIVRSSTISSASTSHRADAGRDAQDLMYQEHKSMPLNGKDIGPLYKPHMNYSTSVLGNHRLSDDDEIIIIPTQSPSLVSTSPDAGDANVDELTERFSISRTKSFWEKLSKGNPSKRSANRMGGQQQDSGSIKMATGQQQQGNKVIGVRMNGHSHTMDHMDSTGGSNSNYSCSSSGDENGGGGGSHSHQSQNPTISQLQEMSRQNRFRQTR